MSPKNLVYPLLFHTGEWQTRFHAQHAEAETISEACRLIVPVARSSAMAAIIINFALKLLLEPKLLPQPEIDAESG